MSAMPDLMMKGEQPPWLQSLRQAQGEWRANARLRAGVWLILATLWLWLILLVQDQAGVWRGEAEEARSGLDRLRPLQATGAIWPQRAEEARKQLEAAKSMMWAAPTQGLVEAALQDHLKALCIKVGLPVRELTIVGAGEVKAATQAGSVVKARLVLDVTDRLALMGLLGEIGRSPKLMMVDGFKFRPLTQPARAELEVRVLYLPGEHRP